MKLFYKQVKTPVKVFQYLHFIFREFHFSIKKFLLQYDSYRHRNTHCSSVAQRDTVTTALQHNSAIARSLCGRDGLLIHQCLLHRREPPTDHTHKRFNHSLLNYHRVAVALLFRKFFLPSKRDFHCLARYKFHCLSLHCLA